MKTKPYTAKTMSGAQQMARSLSKRLSEAHELIKRLSDERTMLAKLAATGPCFFNPLEALAAAALRDRVLRQFCRLNPDGTPIKSSDAVRAALAANLVGEGDDAQSS